MKAILNLKRDCRGPGFSNRGFAIDKQTGGKKQ
jgi:hypothetical protein